MTPDPIEAGQAALRHVSPANAWLATALMFWIGLNVILGLVWPPWLLMIPVIHVGLWWSMISGTNLRVLKILQMNIPLMPSESRFSAPPLPGLYHDHLFLLWAPAVALWLLPDVLQNRCTLADALSAELKRPMNPVSLPDHRLVAPGHALDLSTGFIIGSCHARLEDRAHRTPEQTAELRVLMHHHADAILVSDGRKHALVARTGRVLGIQRIRTPQKGHP